MRQCKGCGASFTGGELHCPYCGTPLVSGAEKPDEAKGKKRAQKERARKEQERKPGGFAEAFREGYRGAASERPRSAREPWEEEPPPLHIFGRDRFQMLIACILAFALGTFGAHWFYLGNPRRAKWYLIFCWTGIPTIVGLVEGVGFLRYLLAD